ncbi:hypothetical protein ACIBQ1_25930 [Nonomuraea sp. NPDC050153]|uniref:hypothetical protein n=1 Tax=Nonomuraea sp. NPDC050153 TaxID=3364359 RepID=UPI0037A29CD4
MLVEPDPQKDVLPFGVEEHRALDVDQHRLIVVVHQHVIGPELPVDQPMVRPRLDACGHLPQRALELLPNRADPLDPYGRLVKVAQRPLQHDLDRGAPPLPPDLPHPWDPLPPHGLQTRREPLHHPARPRRIVPQQRLQRPAADVLDHRDASRPVHEVDLGHPHPEPAQPAMGRLEERQPGGMAERSLRVAVRRGGPEVLLLGPDIDDRAGPVVERQPIDALLAPTPEPLDPCRPPPVPEGRPRDLGEPLIIHQIPLKLGQ